VLIRYFGAAQAATGVAEERLDLGPASVDGVLQELIRRHPADGSPGAPSLERVIGRSSFLLNEVAVRDRSRQVTADDVLDVLPPFAGG
jgi:molybdopterin synthase sulfur carrier subunit